MDSEMKPCPLLQVAEHLAARPFQTGDGNDVQRVANWLDYSLNRCGLVVVEEQSLTRTPDPAIVKLREALEAIIAVDEPEGTGGGSGGGFRMAKIARAALSPSQQDKRL